MDDIFDNDDNEEDFACDPNEEKDDEEKDTENQKQINEKINDIQNNVEESWILNIKKFLDEINEKSEELALKLNQICKEFKFYENSKRLDLIKKIIKDSYNHSRTNFSQRLVDFSEFLLSEPHLDYNIIEQAINSSNLEEISKTNKDIIFFWKENVVGKYCSFLNDKNGMTNYSKKIIKSLLEESFNIAEIYSILYPFRYFISNKKFSQFEILDSIISIIIAYKINQMDDELIKIINDNCFQNKEKGIVELKPKVALEFYLKASESKKTNESNQLSIPQLLHSLKNMNSELTDDIIREREEQLDCIQSIISNKKYQDYEKQDFKRWAKNEFSKLDFEKNANESTAKVLGMISLVIKKENGFYLRNAQLIAILMFIGKEKKYGLVEEISTGEGKSCIICSLSIYFALRKKKVDIISSSYSLAQRDSKNFENIYDYFNLTTSYPRNSASEPYKCDILYGTFLEFEGDCLRELISDKKIRNNRPFEVIIIDEVDNLFIDNILSSTRLTGSTKGFKFLIPLYLSIYLSFELFDFIFLFFFSLNLKVKGVDQKKRQKFEKLIREPEYRKKIIIEFTENIFKNLDNNAPDLEDEDLNELVPKVIDNKIEKRAEKMFNKIEDFTRKLEQYLKYPDFLSSFVKIQTPFWANNAFRAKNYMDKFIDYVITEGENKDVAPVDRTNTGETELSTVYSDGLHQMLEIKEKLRIKDETLTDTFLSHITFFQKYKNSDEFLFFGLTGTIGDDETQKIYKRDYFNSKLLFIPQYKKKRFIELPPKLINFLDHIDNICEDIIINYSYGRRILVICESIKEAQQLYKKLLSFNIKSFKEKNPFVKEDYKNFILLYTRSDTSEKENYKSKIGKIILSTNIGGRGTDIKTTKEQEENGGMHVILTSMPSNYRVLKQAFGRTSREGKKGTGQIIIKKESYQSYSDVIEEMNANEKERIENIQRHLKIILFKDKLFIDFCGAIKHLKKDSCIFDDIKERWAMFLKENISKYNIDDFNEFEFEKEYKDFKQKIEKSLKIENDYDKYNNPFIRVTAGLRKYKKYEKELSKYLDIKMENKKFFFVIPYLKAIILVKNQKNKYNQEFYDLLKGYLNEAKKSVNLLIEKSIDPVLDSFPQWNRVFDNLRLEINENLDENISKKDEETKDFEAIILQKEDFYKQYQNIRNILEKIIIKINSNLDFVENYRIKNGDNQKYFIHTIQKDLKEGLELNVLEEKEKGFFDDASFYYVFDFREELRITQSFIMKFFQWLIFIVFLPLIIATLVIGGISLVAYCAGIVLYDKIRIISRGNLEIENNSIFSNLLYSMIQKFRYENDIQQRTLNAEIENEDEYISYQSLKKSLKTEVYEKLEIEFNYIKKVDIVKFLYFIDIYLSNEFWSKKIRQTIKKNFTDIYEVEFNNNIDLFRRRITKDNYESIKNSLISLFVKFWRKCLLDFINFKNKKEFDEETGINSLEHLIRMHNPNKITEEIIEKTFKQILKYNLINKKGYVNQTLFEDCFTQIINDKLYTLKQKYAINITTKMDDEKITEISKLKDFVIKGIKIPIVSSYFIDLNNFYKKNGYDIEIQKQKDYTLFIINNTKDIIQKMLLLDDDIFDVFFQRLLNDTKLLVKKLLDQKIFSQSNMKNVEKELICILSEKEKEEFKSLIKQTQEDIKKIKNKSK